MIVRSERNVIDNLDIEVRKDLKVDRSGYAFSIVGIIKI